MIPRYSRPEMVAIWSPETKFRIWYEIEAHACDAQAALGVIPILFLAQLAVIVALGVLLDTFVVRTLLVPALVLDLGKVVWWPSRLWREGAR